MRTALALTIRAGAGDGSIVLIDDELVTLRERCDYWVLLDDAGTSGHHAQAWLGVRPLSFDGQKCGFRVDKALFASFIGRNELTVRVGDATRVLTIDVAPHHQPGASGDWLVMLRQLESWLPGVVLGHEGGGVGTVESHEDGPGDPRMMLAAQAWIPLLPALDDALRALLARPLRSDSDELSEVPLHAARRVSGESMRFLARAAHYDSSGLTLRGVAATGKEAMIPYRTSRTDLDHPANRRVHWLIRQLLEQLERLRARLVAAADAAVGHRPRTGEWCRARAALLAEHSQRLTDLLRGSFLSRLPAVGDHHGPLNAFIDHPAYDRLHRLTRFFLAPKFRLPPALDDALDDELDGELDDDRPAPTRPSFDLYALWVFSLVQRSLAARLTAPAWRWSHSELEQLYTGAETGGEACFSAERADAERADDRARLDVLFHCSFPALVHDTYVVGESAREPVRRRSLSATPGRPEILVRFRPGTDMEHRPQTASWVCLAVQYCEPGRVGAALDTLRGYRETLWMDDFGGRPSAGLALVPRCPADTAWARPGYRDRYAIGVWTCPPGASPDLALADWLLGYLLL